MSETATTTIQAIETRYKGYRFRSRLEARWAVFFDQLGIDWEYEAQGYELSNGEAYLPDFFLPRFNCPRGTYVEVKPDGGDFEKAKRFAQGSGGGLILLAEGVPDCRSYEIFTGFGADYVEDFRWDVCCFVAKYLPGGSNGAEYRMFFGAEDVDDTAACPLVIAASNAAKSARFEHGETP